MTIHYATSHRFGDVLVSVDNRTATKVSVWFADEATPRKRFAGHEAYDEAMDYAFDLDEASGRPVEMPNAEAVAIALGGATFNDSDY
jgi:hypothetical protein